MGIIEKIQNKPQATKIKLIWIISAVVVVLLVIIWIISSRFHKNDSKDFSIFQTIGQGAREVKDKLKK